MATVRTISITVTAVVLTVVACAFVESAAIEWVNTLPGIKDSPAWTTWAINIIPAFLTGFLLFFCLAIALLSRHGQSHWRRHAVRASPLYVLAATLLVIIAVSWHIPDFAFVAQFFEWPLCALAGGILGDLLATAIHRRRRATPNSLRQGTSA
jgi:hypothetical protein